nr:immunoglobulin light chain junction region [Macaca mulatta]MOV77450.1 immunoglobulin light chain junction region [Macaca mulatta]
CMQALRSPSSF